MSNLLDRSFDRKTWPRVTISGLIVHDGQDQEASQRERDQYNLWCGIYGSPSHGGWGRDPEDGRHKPLAEFKERL
jgi:hypothetical protein